MLENVGKILKNKKIKFEIEDSDEAECLSFEFKYEDAKVPCAFFYDKEQELFRFYSELAEFDQQTRGEAILVCQLLNLDTVVLKFYMNDENYLVSEYYTFEEQINERLVEQVLIDLENIEDTMEPYFI